MLMILLYICIYRKIMGISFVTQFNRLERQPLDVYSVFDNHRDFEDYLATKPAFAGQIVAVVKGELKPDVYVIYKEGDTYTFSPIGFDINIDLITIDNPFNIN